MQIIKKVFTLIKRVISDPAIISNWLTDNYKSLKKEYIYFRTHLYNLKSNNIKLGLYHLKMGNISDAKLRFWLISKLIAPKDAENFYWYGWAYLLNGQYQEAKECWCDNPYDGIGLFNYLSTYKTLREIPASITDKYLTITRKFYIKRYSDDKNDVISSVFKIIAPYIQVDNGDDELRLLEIGGHTVASDARLKQQSNLMVDRLEFYPSSLQAIKDSNSSYLYNNLFLVENTEIPTEVKSKKYDVVLALNSLSTTLDIAKYLKQYKDLLLGEGVLVIMLPIAESNILNLRDNSFEYQLQFVEQQLTLAEFKIKSINKIILLTQNTYYIIIAS